MTLRVAFIALVAAGTVATLATPADAQGSGPYADGGYVVAESQWGNGTVSGAVRRGGPTGWQVQMPRGTWINCVRSCSQTLRRATVDFWQTVGRNAPDTGPEYFRWEFRF
ncbi:MAG: hypothetical protein ABWZ74_05740 [Hyphomicrobiaceae bacterium]|jgi:hypothetical protein